MFFSKLFAPTLRESPADAEVISHKLMVRAGMIRKVAAGIYNLLPLGNLVMQNVERIVREELTRAGAQEVVMPVVIQLLFTRAHAELFDITSEEPLYDMVVEQSGKYYIFSFKSFEEATREGFEPRKEQLVDNLRKVRENEALLNWLEDLRAGADIMIKRDLQ